MDLVPGRQTPVVTDGQDSGMDTSRTKVVIERLARLRSSPGTI